MSKMTAYQLASELGVTQGDMFKAMQDLGLGVKRMGAQLNANQQSRLRQHFAGRDARRSQPARLVRPQPAPARPAAKHPFPKTCGCCGRAWTLWAVEDFGATLCEECDDHYVINDEPVSRRLDRAETHARLFQADRDQAQEEAARAKENASRAFRARNKWRAALTEVLIDHEDGPDGVCWCGTSPCRTWRALEQANRGIHRDVEKMASWHPDRLQEFLYKDVDDPPLSDVGETADSQPE